jgi:membrane protein implicated in regulation of membrane protease activity
VKTRERRGGAGLPLLGAASALAVCCTIHLIILAGGLGAVAAVAGRWWPAAAVIAAVTASAVAGVRLVRRRGGKHRQPTGYSCDTGVGGCRAGGSARYVIDPAATTGRYLSTAAGQAWSGAGGKSSSVPT